jgi:hypothetical protein
MSTPAEILNLQSAASAALSGAVAFLKGGLDVTSPATSLADLTTFFNTFKYFEGAHTMADITAYITKLEAWLETAQIPTEPPKLGTIAFGDPPIYTPTDLVLLRTALDSLLAVIGTIPSKITEAITIADSLYVLLMNDLNNGGYGITEVDELALYNRVRDRETLASGTLIDELRHKAAALGYQIPPGALTSAINETIIKGNQTVSETNREIYNKRAELYRDNRKFTIEQAQAISKFYVDFTSKKADLLQMVSQSKLAEAKLTVESFLGEIQGFEVKVNALVKEQDILGKIYELRTGMWGKKVEASSTVVQSVTQAHATIATAEALMANGKLDTIKTAIDKYKSELNIWLGQIQSIGSAYSAACGSAYGAVSGIVAYITEETAD